MDQGSPTRAPRKPIAPGAGQVNDELEVGFDADFEKSWADFERIGRMALVAIVLAAMTGLLGAGPLDHRTIGSMKDGGAVDVEPIVRFGTTTQITVHLPPGVDRFRIDSALVEPLGLAAILPQPLRAEPVEGGASLVFALPDAPGANMVRLKGRPSAVGIVPVTIVIGDGVVRHWREIVLP